MWHVTQTIYYIFVQFWLSLKFGNLFCIYMQLDVWGFFWFPCVWVRTTWELRREFRTQRKHLQGTISVQAIIICIQIALIELMRMLQYKHSTISGGICETVVVFLKIFNDKINSFSRNQTFHDWSSLEMKVMNIQCK